MSDMKRVEFKSHADSTRAVLRDIVDIDPKRFVSDDKLYVFCIRKATISKPHISDTCDDVSARALSVSECTQRNITLSACVYIWFDIWCWSECAPVSSSCEHAPNATYRTGSAKRMKHTHVSVNKCDSDWSTSRAYQMKCNEGIKQCRLDARTCTTYRYLESFLHRTRHRLMYLPIPCGSFACHSSDIERKLVSSETNNLGSYIVRGSQYISMMRSHLKVNHVFTNTASRIARVILGSTRVMSMYLSNKPCKFLIPHSMLLVRLPFLDSKTKGIPWFVVYRAMSSHTTGDLKSFAISSVIRVIDTWLVDKTLIHTKLRLEMIKMLEMQVDYVVDCCKIVDKKGALCYIGRRTNISCKNEMEHRRNKFLIANTIQEDVSMSLKHTSGKVDDSHCSREMHEMERLGILAVNALRSPSSILCSLANVPSCLIYTTARLLLCAHGSIADDDANEFKHKRVALGCAYLRDFVSAQMKIHMGAVSKELRALAATRKCGEAYPDLMKHSMLSKRLEGVFSARTKNGNECAIGLPLLHALVGDNFQSHASQQASIITPASNKNALSNQSKLINNDVGLCLVETPIGISAGASKPMSIFGIVTQCANAVDKLIDCAFIMYNFESILDVVDEHFVSTEEEESDYDKVTLFHNGQARAIGPRDEMLRFVQDFRIRRHRLYGGAHPSITVSLIESRVDLYTDAGRVSIPLIRYDRLASLYAPTSVSDSRCIWESLDWSMLLSEQYIDMIDASEMANVILMPNDYVHNGDASRSPFTHVHLSAVGAHMGPSASMGILMEHSKSTRHVLECAQTTIQPRVFNHLRRTESVLRVSEYSCRPLVFSSSSIWMRSMHASTGRSMCVAIGDFSQQGYADAMCMDQASIDRGTFRETHYYTTSVCETRHGARRIEMIMPPRNASASLSHLDHDGFARLGSFVGENHIVAGRVTVAAGGVERCNHLVVNGSNSGIVHRCLVTSTRNGTRMGKIVVRKTCKPAPGDKFKVRPSVKGVLATTIMRHDMIFASNGQTIELILNYTSLLNRMTLGTVMEMILGTHAARHGSRADGTSFLHRAYSRYLEGGMKYAEQIEASGLATGNTDLSALSRDERFEIVERAMASAGMLHKGRQRITSGRTGKSMNGQVFCFGSGTQVLLGDGSAVNVERIRIGDSVMGAHGMPVPIVDVRRGADTLFRLTADQCTSTSDRIRASSHMDAYTVSAHHTLVTRCDMTPRITFTRRYLQSALHPDGYNELHEQCDAHSYTVYRYRLQPFLLHDSNTFLSLDEYETHFYLHEYAGNRDAMREAVERCVDATTAGVIPSCYTQWNVTMFDFMRWRKSRPLLVDRVHLCWHANPVSAAHRSSPSVILNRSQLLRFLNQVCQKQSLSVTKLPVLVAVQNFVDLDSDLSVNQRRVIELNGIEEAIAWFMGAWLNGGVCIDGGKLALRIPYYRISRNRIRDRLADFARLFGMVCEDWYIACGLKCQGIIFSPIHENRHQELMELLNTWGMLVSARKHCEVNLFYMTTLQQTQSFRCAMVQGFIDVAALRHTDFAATHDGTCLVRHGVSTSYVRVYKDMSRLPEYDHEISIECTIYICLALRSLGYRAVMQGEKAAQDLPILVSILDMNKCSMRDENRDYMNNYWMLQNLADKHKIRTATHVSTPIPEAAPICLTSDERSSVYGYAFCVHEIEYVENFYGLVMDPTLAHLHRHQFLLAGMQVVHNCGELHVDSLVQRAEDLSQCRTTGPRHWTTRQPLNGNSRNGGLQFGEQEASALIASGAPHALHQFRTTTSDPHVEHICANCGQYAQYSIGTKSASCIECAMRDNSRTDSSRIIEWRTNYAFIQHDKSVRSLGIWPSFEMDNFTLTR